MLSVVVPVYNEEKMIRKSVLRIDSVLNSADIAHEIILVNDGSRDGTWAELQALTGLISGVRAVCLSRNFGKEGALFAGLDLAEGDCCICLDGDMQHPPEVIPEMYELWKTQGVDVVEGVKANRGNERLSYKLSAGAFYKLMHKLSGIDLRDASDFRLLDRQALEALRSLPEKQTFFRGMSSWIGFKRGQVEFHVADREEGETKWSLLNLMKLAIHAITSFTAAPLYLSSILGFCLLVAFIFMLAQTLIMKILGFASDGFTTVIGLQLVIGGALLTSVGTIGIYIEKIYEEVKKRPRYIVKSVTRSEDVN